MPRHRASGRHREVLFAIQCRDVLVLCATRGAVQGGAIRSAIALVAPTHCAPATFKGTSSNPKALLVRKRARRPTEVPMNSRIGLAFVGLIAPLQAAPALAADVETSVA